MLRGWLPAGTAGGGCCGKAQCTAGDPSQPRLPGSTLPHLIIIAGPQTFTLHRKYCRCYTPRVEELLQRRREVQARFDAGAKPDWLPETAHVRVSQGLAVYACGCGMPGGATGRGYAYGGHSQPALLPSLACACDAPPSGKRNEQPQGCLPLPLLPLPLLLQVRNGDWRVAPLPADLQDRRVEITGPTDRKMVINALNR